MRSAEKGPESIELALDYLKQEIVWHRRAGRYLLTATVTGLASFVGLFVGVASGGLSGSSALPSLFVAFVAVAAGGLPFTTYYGRIAILKSLLQSMLKEMLPPGGWRENWAMAFNAKWYRRPPKWYPFESTEERGPGVDQQRPQSPNGTSTLSEALGDVLRPSGNWRKGHPKWHALLVAMVFFGLLAVTLVLESYSPGQALLYSGLRTLFAAIGGSGFAAFVSMSIYEYVTARNQEREWKHDFDLAKVEHIFGPLYDELQTKMETLRSDLHLSPLKLAGRLEYQYLALLVPESLLEKTRHFSRWALEFGELHDRVQGIMNEMIIKTTREYIRKVGGPDVSFSLGGGEWKIVFGAENSSFRENYDRIVEMVRSYLEKAPVAAGSVSDFEVQLRAALLPIENARQLMQLRETLMALGKELLGDIEPFIKAPYRL